MNTNEPTTPNDGQIMKEKCQGVFDAAQELFGDPPSDAPTPETDDQAKHWSYRFCDAPDANIYINADFARRLERERDEARAELAKRSGDSHIDAPPTDGSAVEWVKERLFTQWDDDGNAQWYLCKTDALELARRADEAEALIARAKADAEEERYETNRTASALQATEGILKDVRAQLAAAQAEAGRLREALLAMREYYKEHMITGKLHKQVEAALAKEGGR